MALKKTCGTILCLILLMTANPLVMGTAHAKKKPPQNNLAVEDFSSLIISGNYSKALQQIQKSNLKKIKGSLEQRLKFMSAYLHYQGGHYKEAVKLFKEIRDDYEIIQDYVLFYLGISLREAGEAKDSIQVLTQLKSKALSPHLSTMIERELALAYCKAGDRGKAIQLFNQLIQTVPSDIQSYHYRFDRAQCLITLGYPQEAIVGLRTLYLNYPEGDLSEVIRKSLLENGGGKGLNASEHLARADQLIRHDRPALAVQDLEAAEKLYGSHPPGFLVEKMAQTYFQARQYPQAAKTYEKLRDRYPESFGKKEELKLAQAYSRSDQFDKAIQTYERIKAKSPASQYDNLDYKIAFLYMDKGDYKKANQLFEELLENYPKHGRKAQIYWFLAWNHYLLKQYDQALVYLDLLESTPGNGRFGERVPYWRARILEKQGQTRAARAIYQNLADQERFSYYGFLSLKRLEGNLDATQPPKNGWVQELPRLPVPTPFSLSRIKTTQTKALQRLQELYLLGLWEDFLGELNYVTAQEGATGDLRELQTLIQGNRRFWSNPEMPWEYRYPPAYATLVSLFSQSRNFPMYLTWAIMREESRFQPDVVSSAQAIGLMQIIPPTGMEISQDLGRRGFVPELLYQPVVNIEYGVHYLDKNRKRFSGALPPTIASYNAGPEAVTRWLKARPNREWDEFVEEIPYKETNNYVKKVLKSYYIYRLIYSS